MVDRGEDKRNPSTVDRSHQLALTHLRQHTIPSMSLSQHPIIRSVVFGKDISRLPIELTTGWLLGKVIRFDNRVHTPASGWGHYPTTHEVIPLFISACRNADTGGKGSITQWVHVEYMEGSETICPTFTQWVRGGYFSKVPTKVPTG